MEGKPPEEPITPINPADLPDRSGKQAPPDDVTAREELQAAEEASEAAMEQAHSSIQRVMETAAGVPGDPPLLHYDVPRKTLERLDNTFTYHSPRTDQIPRYQVIRDVARDLALCVARLTPPSREQSLALTKLEEAVMHANAAIARNEAVAPGDQPQVPDHPVDDANQPK